MDRVSPGMYDRHQQQQQQQVGGYPVYPHHLPGHQVQPGHHQPAGPQAGQVGGYTPHQQYIQSFQQGYTNNNIIYQQQQQQQHLYQPYQYEQQHHQSYVVTPQAYNFNNNNSNNFSNDISHQQQQQQQQLRQESKFVVTRPGPIGSASQASAAASFYARRHQQSAKHQQPPQGGGLLADSRFNTNSSEEEERLATNFRSIIVRASPPLPPSLAARIDSSGAGQAEAASGLGKVRVIVRISSKRPLPETDSEEQTSSSSSSSRYFNVDRKKRQVTLLDPAVAAGRAEIPIEERKVGVAAPKMFAYDGIFGTTDSQEEVAAACLADVIASVIGGNDGCLFSFGHTHLGKSYTMVGEDTAKSSIGIIPTAIAWMYKVIKERKAKTSARFSVRVSAVEISQEESLRDLLKNYASATDQSPGVYLRQLPASQACALANLSEVRASSVDKAAYFLDAALSNRTRDAQGRDSHFLYTIHVYQYSVERSGQGGVAGGRSRLHLIDFGGCDRSQQPGSHGITLSGLGNVILGIFNGQKHLPCRNSKVTGVLRECLGSLTCNATMVAHVSPEPSHYSETLHTLQLASRIHRMRRKRMKAGGGSSSSRTGGGSHSSDEGRHRGGRSSSKSGSSDFTTSTDPSSSEMSCNTVVYRGHSDGSGTDGEHPPTSGLQRFKRRNLSGSRILTNGTISPRLSASPQPPPSSPLSPANSQYLISSSSPASRLTPTLPAIREANHHAAGGKMPLNGKVPGYRQPAQVWIDGERGYPTAAAAASGSSPGQRYGFMDDFKANMISSWVENQTTTEPGHSGGGHYLTQFKTADSSDSGSERILPETTTTKVEVHQPREAVQPLASAASNHSRRSGPPPPPPPRRSSSREKELDLGGSVVGFQPYALSKSTSSPRGDTLKLNLRSLLPQVEAENSQQQQQQQHQKQPSPSPLPSPGTDLGEDLEQPQEAGQHHQPQEAGLNPRLSPRGETEGSDSSEPLPEPNFDQLFPSELLGKRIVVEFMYIQDDTGAKLPLHILLCSYDLPFIQFIIPPNFISFIFNIFTY